MTSSCQIVSTPEPVASGIVARRSARAASPTIRIRRLRMRSTHAPAGSGKQDEREKAEHREQREDDRGLRGARSPQRSDRELRDLRTELADRLTGPEA